MKLYGFAGKGTGKLGSSVFSIVGGQQIVRTYNPVVKNPQTILQVNQRVRFKLLSQMAAALSSVLAIRSQNSISARNRFTQINSKFVYGVNEEAFVSYENLQLTDSAIALPGITVVRSAENIALSLQESAAGVADSICYAVFSVNSEGQLMLRGSKVVKHDDADTTFTFPTTIKKYDGQVIIYAYGMRELDASANSIYGNYKINTGQDVAKLLSDRNEASANIIFTQTRGTSLLDNSQADAGTTGGDSGTATGDSTASVFVTASSGGTASGAGTFKIGSEVTVTATAKEGYNFSGWRINGQSSYISTAAQYKFTLQGTTDLIAIFTAISSDSGGSSYIL